MADAAPTFEGEPEAMSVARAAALLGLPESEVRRRIAAREFPVVAVGSRLMVMAPALRRWAETSGRQHRAQAELAAHGHGRHAAAATAQGTPCPTCHSPLVPVTSYVSLRYGRVAVCPHSPDYYPVDLARPLRVYDLVPDTRVGPSAA